MAELSASGEDPFEVLGLPLDASHDTIRAKYKELALKVHPDKTGGDDDTTAAFHRLKNAHDTLINDEKRAAYEEQKEREAQRKRAEAAAEVDLDDMTWNETKESYSYDCRCGSQFVITTKQLEDGYDTVGCGGCSQTVTVLYAVEDDGNDAGDGDGDGEQENGNGS